MWKFHLFVIEEEFCFCFSLNLFSHATSRIWINYFEKQTSDWLVCLPNCEMKTKVHTMAILILKGPDPLENVNDRYYYCHSEFLVMRKVIKKLYCMHVGITTSCKNSQCVLEILFKLKLAIHVVLWVEAQIIFKKKLITLKWSSREAYKLSSHFVYQCLVWILGTISRRRIFKAHNSVIISHTEIFRVNAAIN